MARTTPWTEKQQKAIEQLEADGRITNKRPCGCFDVAVGEEANKHSEVALIMCDTCRVMLTNWRPAVFGRYN